MLDPHIEPATEEDIPALAHLRTAQGWLPSPRLLRTIQVWPGGRVFLIRESSLAPAAARTATPAAPIATASAIAASHVGVIGNVIVRDDYRRRGLGRLTMEAALRWLRECGARHVLLAATPEGRPLYTRLGFVATEPSWFAHGSVDALDRGVLLARADGLRARVAPAGALGAYAAMDAAAFGGDRLGLLELLLREPETWLHIVTGEGATKPVDSSPAGYLILRRLRSHRQTLQIGPWVATTPSAAAALLASLLDADAPWRERFLAEVGPRMFEPRILAGVDRRAALALVVAAGAALIEDDVVMQLDFAPGADPQSIVATGGPPQPVAAHPEWLYAWLAPMVF